MNTTRLTQAHIGAMIAIAAVMALILGALTALGGADASTPLIDQISGSTVIDPTDTTSVTVPSTNDGTSSTSPSSGSEADAETSDGQGGVTPAPSPQPQDPPAPNPPAPKNLPPTIDDPGLSSTGLHLVVAPVTSDPDGSVAAVEVVIDGMLAEDHNGTFARDFVRADVGIEHLAAIEITVTDDKGSTWTDAFEHQLEAIDRITVGPVVYRVTGRQCFSGRTLARRLSGVFELRGPVVASVAFDEELRADRASFEIVPAQTVETPAVATKPVSDVSRFVIGDVNEFHTANTGGPATVSDTIGAGRSCVGNLSYTIQIEEL